MKAVRKLKWKIFSAIAVTAFSLLQCANPADQDVRWRTSVELPVTAHKKVLLGAMMDTLFFNHNLVQTNVTYDTTRDTIHRTGLPDSIVRKITKNIDTTMQLINGYPVVDTVTKKPIPDTVDFGFPTHDTASSTISEDSLKDKEFHAVFGPILLSGTPSNAVTIPLAGPYTGGVQVSAPPVPVTVKYVYRIELSDTAQSVLLNLVNNTSAAFSSVSVTLGSLGSSTLSTLSPGSSGTLSFDARGKIIDSVMNVTIAVTPQASGIYGAGDNLAANFSMNGLVANRVVVLDSMLTTYHRLFTNSYNLTDTVDVDYIDIDKGFFIYSVTNNTNLDLLLSVTHRHLWRSDFCQGRTPEIMKREDLVGLSSNDSVIAYNGSIAKREAFPPNATNEYSKHNISANRLFAEWDSSAKKSVTMVDYRVDFGTYGRRITLSSNDSLLFVIKTTSFKFKEMYGKSMEEYTRDGKPSVIPVKLPWAKNVTDSLRNHFVLQKVLAKIKTRIDIPAGAFIDTIKVHYMITSITHPTVACSSNAVLLHVIRDSTYQRELDISNVVNDYPDSVRVNVSLKIPAFTTIKAVNDLIDAKDTAYPKYIGRMIMHGLVNYNMVAPLCWTVLDTASMDLGGDTLDLKKVGFVTDPMKKMTDRHATFTVDVINFTNIYLKLYALVATDSSKVGPLVDSSKKATYISTNKLTELINNPTPGFVSLLGKGLLIPPRDSTTSVRNTIALSENDLSQILRAKVSGWRWQVRFLPKTSNGALDTTSDALLNTDWIKLNSWIHVDGVNSIDSLIQ